VASLASNSNIITPSSLNNPTPTPMIIETNSLVHASWSAFANTHVSTPKHSLTLYQNNVRGFNNFNNFNDWKASLCLLSELPKLIVLSEVKLKPSVQISLYNLRHYTLYACLRDSTNSKGGLLVYVHDTISHCCTDNVSSSFEKITIKISLPNATFNLISVYRPPIPENFNDFCVSIEKSLEERCKYVALAGDFNVDKNSSTSESRKFRSLLQQFNVKIANIHPTRPVSGKIIDHFSCNFYECLKTDIHTIDQDPTVSDHCIIFSRVYTEQPPSKAKAIVTKNILDFTLLEENFNLCIEDINSIYDPNVVAEKITSATKLAINQSTRTITATLKNDKNIAPWLNGKLLEMMKTKDRWQEKLRNHPGSARNRSEFKHACEEFKREN